ncbi:YbbR-like domain-containing protein [Oscillochloris sp. ZM17-4]|uniref:CdaR family protein n=1 Tax=Oscillochloris sp. ZM17-4 TaxID=2866714 RepID=UPI00272E1410|nr:CdaR family protein [Oscillochloris sp. ZM17-4]
MTTLRAMTLRALLALGLSFALWAFVSFSQNPEELVPFEGLTPQVVGLGSDLVIVDANGLPNPTLPSVNVTLRTDRNQRAELRPVDIRTVVDLTGLGSGEHIVPVNVQATRSTISFTVPADGVTPSAIPFRIEEIMTGTVPIDLKVAGNLPFSFERGEPQITFSGVPIGAVQITGPQNRVQRVTAAQTTANIEQLRASYQAPLSLVAVDENGQTVDGVQISPGTVNVRIPITSVVGLKLVPVQASIVGLPASGYVITAVQVDPPLIALTGSSGPLDAVLVLETEDVDIGGARGSLVRQARISFPAGTSPQLGEPSSAKVTVLISPVSQSFQVTLPAEVAVGGVGGGMLMSVSPNSVSVTITGSSAFLDQLAQQPLKANVDVSGLGPGSYQLPVTVSLPSGVRLAGEPPSVTVVLRTPPPSPTSPASPTAEPPTDVTATLPSSGTPEATPVLEATPPPEAVGTPDPVTIKPPTPEPPTPEPPTPEPTP